MAQPAGHTYGPRGPLASRPRPPCYSATFRVEAPTSAVDSPPGHSPTQSCCSLAAARRGPTAS
eukprot:7086301-Lingulodinium_polyedra.AAC.1